ncbi:T6SS amidase immunity protein Tai4 family protein [Cronobacter sakazakii]|uniref:T6SS amidase immunity protein Tai4 family protein n=1 Tax=Cronobacter sakazakii TaxID=28141 RepID=UPI0007AB48CF|nr:T6SS amidase immunity protein Tai4 family protein [Cronobacter sakazakii]EGT4352599.1 type VI secretion protein [Cronobacter sakazakii]EKK4015147.1 type VI secretion system amidase immunity protein Tai4 [Cronobacter sakazakii]ELY2896214.1 type VI secretion system amidase immunity protein Tai4 [Cronobacter sakazakii]ELY3421137.1 type VI secretion system amidase immunity protein Tai4 [Cronobacter sakazakii]ELY3749012.1 type VI secretion system amidase immunity protein Tai4 [Cronobacter sakaza
MDIKIKFCFALTLLISSQAIARTTTYSPEEYLRNYALSTCIAQGYNSEEVKNDAAAAARGYLEFGDYSIEAHTAVVEMGKTFLKRKYGSQSGEPMTLAKCIDFYHSKELADVIKKYKGKVDD